MDILEVNQPDDVIGVIGGISFSGMDEKIREPINKSKGGLPLPSTLTMQCDPMPLVSLQP